MNQPDDEIAEQVDRAFGEAQRTERDEQADDLARQQEIDDKLAAELPRNRSEPPQDG